MKIRIASDLHFELHADDGEAMTRELTTGDFDVLVIAGDLDSFGKIYRSLVMVCAMADPKPVVYVHGNHEAYGGEIERVYEDVVRAKETAGNLVYLERETAMVLGRRFVGCALWYRHSSGIEPLDRCIADFVWIHNIYSWLKARGKKSADFLRETVREDDIVVTHYLPHPNSIADKYNGSSLNGYFLNDVSDVVEGRKAALWIHGHTHTSCDYVVGSTRVVCNPLGYVTTDMPDEPNVKFSSSFDIEV